MSKEHITTKPRWSINGRYVSYKRINHLNCNYQKYLKKNDDISYDVNVWSMTHSVTLGVGIVSLCHPWRASHGLLAPQTDLPDMHTCFHLGACHVCMSEWHVITRGSCPIMPWHHSYANHLYCEFVALSFNLWQNCEDEKVVMLHYSV